MNKFETPEYPPVSEIRQGMRIDWDVPIRMNDGIVLRADVFRPVGDGEYPALLSYGPYGKGLAFQEGYKTAWDIMARDYPDAVANSTNIFQSWEVADPEKWVPDGYVCVRVDSRGAGRSPGVLEPNSAREIEDFHDCIQWAAAQDWSNGKVGLTGISYFAANQWRVAATRPPALAALCIWEGYSDRYREVLRHGGIISTFSKNWLEMQVKTVQHGLGERGPRSAATGELVCGPETLSEEELREKAIDPWTEVMNRPLDSDYYAALRADLSMIEVPLLSAGNWGGNGLHLRGNVEGFLGAGSGEKWLELHGGTHWAVYYTDYANEMQKAFFGHYLKGEDTGWDKRKPIILNIRHVDRFEMREEEAWPLPGTDWRKMHLDPSANGLTEIPPSQDAVLSWRGMSGELDFRTGAFERETEITGPIALRLQVSSSTADADIFAIVRLYDPDGREMTFQGALDPHTPIAQGWLRCSRRKTDPERSFPWRPYHPQDEAQPLHPGMPVSIDVEIWPTSIVVPAGYALGLTLKGSDYEWEGAAETLSNIRNPMRGCGPFLHDDPEDRPSELYDGVTTVHFGPQNENFLLLPVIPPNRAGD